MQTAITASGKTGTTCAVSGPYKSSRNVRVTVFVKKGEKFPRDYDGASTTWALVK